jgi:hypothetical protein
MAITCIRTPKKRKEKIFYEPLENLQKPSMVFTALMVSYVFGYTLNKFSLQTGPYKIINQ